MLLKLNFALAAWPTEHFKKSCIKLTRADLYHVVVLQTDLEADDYTHVLQRTITTPSGQVFYIFI